MNTLRAKKWIYIISFLLMSGGFVVGWWVVSLLGILFAAFGDAPVAAVLLGLLLDIAYGPPVGFLHYLFFPFTVAALVAIVVRILAERFMLTRSTQERL
jgi:hypothetical protein